MFTLIVAASQKYGLKSFQNLPIQVNQEKIQQEFFKISANLTRKFTTWIVAASQVLNKFSLSSFQVFVTFQTSQEKIQVPGLSQPLNLRVSSFKLVLFQVFKFFKVQVSSFSRAKKSFMYLDCLSLSSLTLHPILVHDGSTLSPASSSLPLSSSQLSPASS